MPKISNDYIGYQKGILERSKAKNNNLKAEDVFLRLKVGDKVRCRIIGGHIDFVAHWPRIDDGERDGNNIVWKNSTFPDAKERNYKPTRICTDDTPARERLRDIEGYLNRTKCPWCKLRFQGYHGNLRHAFNVIVRPENVCKILEIPPTAMGELSNLCEQYAKYMPDGPGSVKGKVLEFIFHRSQENKWNVSRYENLDVDTPSIMNDLVGLTEEDIKALKKINPDATTEEELLRGHDLERWYRKDYLSAEWQRKLAKALGLNPGEYLELSPYEQSLGLDNEVLENFETENELEEPDIENFESDDLNFEDESYDWSSSNSTYSNKDTDYSEVDINDEENTDEGDDSPLW